jgi:hypothetical protein
LVLGPFFAEIGILPEYSNRLAAKQGLSYQEKWSLKEGFENPLLTRFN